ncbi:MAG: multicopper oxidase domain-containing protein, partial [Candidatus Sulfotelmatobacter sp.]
MKVQRALGLGILFVLSCASSCLATTRHYYIAAEDVTWNYAPSGFNLLNGNPIPLPWRDKVQWPKTRYIEYTDDSFTTPKRQPEWLGILGPLIRAEVGDEIVVEFLNRSRRAHDIHPHGLHYDKSNEGSLYLPVAKGAFVLPGARYT